MRGSRCVIAPADEWNFFSCGLGTGLQGLAELLQERVEVQYQDIPGFGESTVRGHQSALAFGFLGKSRTPVVAQLGR